MYSPDMSKVNRHTGRQGWHLTCEAEMGGVLMGWHTSDDSAQLLDGRRLSFTV